MGFGVADLVAGLIGYLAIFQGLPARDPLVDGPAAVVIALLFASGIGLTLDRAWALPLARAAAAVTLVAGLLLFAALAVGASYLAGISGPVGRGGVLLEVLCAALALPYLVLLPAAQLVWARAATPE